uniref:Uncharacterized protein n=1 Tax=Parascaris univalens TaxID=6257 RepID=A0A915C9B5_PARUN
MVWSANCSIFEMSIVLSEFFFGMVSIFMSLNMHLFLIFIGEMSTERRRSLRSDSPPWPSSSGQQTSSQKGSLYPTEQLRELADSLHSEAFGTEEGVVHRKPQYSFTQGARKGSYETADESESDEELEGEEYSRSLPRPPSDSGVSPSILFLCLFAVVILISISVYYYSQSTAVTTAKTLENYRLQMARLLKKRYPKEGDKTRNILRLIGEKLILQEAIEPYVVLIAGERAANFSADIVNVFLNVTNRGAMERIILNGQKKRYELDKEIMRSLSKGSKTVILDGVDKLRGDTPLSLHSVCDPDHSPFSSALILLTINRPLRALDSQCEIAVSSLLVYEWRSEYMNKDRISPIISRITSYVICLRE